MFAGTSLAQTEAQDTPIFDQDAKPLTRGGAMMPEGATESGYCCVIFDVTEGGKTTNVDAAYCTLDIFRNESENSVRQWIYEPARKDGEPVQRHGVVTTLVYKVTDATGLIVPSHTGWYRLKSGTGRPTRAAPFDRAERRAWEQEQYDTQISCDARIS